VLITDHWSIGLLSTEAGTLGRVVGDVCISTLAGLAFVQTHAVDIVNLLYVPLGIGLCLCLVAINYHYELLAV
jgi:hypothetical protein